MLRQRARRLSRSTTAALAELQERVNAANGFAARAALAGRLWDQKTGTVARKRAFLEIRDQLARMCYGSVRCSYCEDSAADEIEHIAPKSLFPRKAFRWDNYCFACGPCNGPKGNLFAVVRPDGTRVEADPKLMTREPRGLDALINPRAEDPTRLLELDIGGTAAGGLILTATSDFMVREGLNDLDKARATWTIELLDLNREVVRKARETAYQSYRASLREYAQARTDGEPEDVLAQMRDGILAMPHPTVLNEMIRQAATQPIVSNAIAAAPEIAGWIR